MLFSHQLISNNLVLNYY